MRIQGHIKKEVEQLRLLINYFNQQYYVHDDPQTSDEKFDTLMRELETLEAEHPYLVTPYSPTQRVGGVPAIKFKKIERETPMLSLGAMRSKAEALEFDKRVRKATDSNEVEYAVELKIDGLAVELEYHHGFFVRGSTRGNGLVGEDITANLKTLGAVPLTLDKIEDVVGHIPKRLTVRGEVFMHKADLKKLNKERKKNKEKPYPDTRTAASASLRRLDHRITAKRKLDVFFYSIVPTEDVSPLTQISSTEMLQELGFKVNPHTMAGYGMDWARQTVKEMRSLRKKLTYDADGVVVKVNSTHDQEKLGNSAKYPNWAVAVKF
ncbi:MAG: hypothetical protein KAT46_05330 [Deltaproteobacteria bacterium]|nr:hypothetical protein [Deltaproteobacteria bacterium]